MKKNAGFTLIELVIVIIVLGILAATAVPKFINLQDDAKESAMKGVEASVHSAANIVYSKAAIDGIETDAGKAVSAAGETVQLEFGYPEASADGIMKAVELSGFELNTKAATTTPVASVIIIADGEDSENDACILYTEAKDKDTAYKVVNGKLNSGATTCTK